MLRNRNAFTCLLVKLKLSDFDTNKIEIKIL